MNEWTLLRKNLCYLLKLQDGLSITELARKTDIPQPTLHHLLRGLTKKPRKQVLERLAKFFSVSVTELTGILPITPIFPQEIKESLNIIKIPIISWDLLRKWPAATSDLPHIILEGKQKENAFALKMNTTFGDSIFPENSLLIFNPNKQPKDREFIVTYLGKKDSILFNRVFLEGNEYFIKHSQSNDIMELIKLDLLSDKIIGTLIEARLFFD